MSINISNIWQSQNQVSSNSNTNNSGVISNNSDSQNNNTVPVSELTSGSSLSGKILSADADGKITILLSDQSTLSATVKGGVSLLPGSTVSFLVSSTQGNQITLNPLHTNLNTTPTIQNALLAAGLEQNETNVSMVNQMMKQGMNINKDSLLSMNKTVTNNPNVDTSIAVKLSQLGIEVNEANAKQYVSYENMNHQLANGVNTIANDLSNAFVSLNGEDAKAMQLFQEVVNLISSEASDSSVNQLLNELGVSDLNVLFDDLFKNVQKEGSLPKTDAQITDSQITDPQITDSKDLEFQLLKESATKEIVDSSNNKNIESLLKGPETTLQNILDNNEISNKDLLKLLNTYLTSEFNGKDLDGSISKFLSSSDVGKVLKEALEQNWLLKPEEFSSKEKVENFYNKLQYQTEKLAEVSKEILGNSANLTQSVTTLSNNVDFMNQLNQMFSYVQIPLKLSNQNANGDLFVYTNKKNLASKDGSVSAYLHLSMDHLGDVDCYVTMKDQRVSTNFKVASDEILDLIELNIDLLNERLEKRGYHLNCNVSINNEETSVIGEMQKQLGVTASPISMTSFDAKA